ncbi:MAG: phosphatidate cytidylyltransferase [Rhodospirillales bacterium]|nr:phosphatidate cytidylyltransferase [Rhodospirillales bacterium]
MAAPQVDVRPGGLSQRLVSAIVLIPPVLAAVYFGSPYFELMVLAGAAVLAWEWRRLCSVKPDNRAIWRLAGALAIVLPCLALLWLRQGPGGREAILWLFLVVWAADTGAYATGRALGGPKLAPSISPAKTWAGLLGAIVAAGLAGVAAAMLLSGGSANRAFALGAVLGAVSQMGDLAESWAKRKFGVKDASRLIPGHGGLMDRIDGLFAAALAVAVVEIAAGWTGRERVLAWL